MATSGSQLVTTCTPHQDDVNNSSAVRMKSSHNENEQNKLNLVAKRISTDILNNLPTADMTPDALKEKLHAIFRCASNGIEEIQSSPDPPASVQDDRKSQSTETRRELELVSPPEGRHGDGPGMFMTTTIDISDFIVGETYSAD